MGRRKDYTGQKFHYLTAIEFSHIGRSNESRWLYKCDCGNEKIISSWSVVAGRTKSCGCYALKIRTIHGKSKTPEYNSWNGMRQRCYSEKHRYYKYYGGKGITICERWLNSFEDFLEDMGERPKGTTLDRKDGSKGYYKENCRWATGKEQQNNRKSTIVIEYNGTQKTITEWAEEYDINFFTLWSRLHERKWPIEKALTTPVRKIKLDKQ